MSDELKPCPFCGSENVHIRSFEIVYEPQVVCDVCGASAKEQGCWTGSGNEGKSMEELTRQAIEAWNTRAERTCHMYRRPATFPGSIGYLTCSFCDCGFDYTEEPFNCMNCGAKVVDDD